MSNEVTINCFTIREKDSFPPNSNPYCFDGYHMGQSVGTNIEIMHKAYDKDHAEFIILIDKRSGKRIVIEGFAPAENEQVTPSEGA